MKKYRISKYKNDIEEFEITKETKKCIFYYDDFFKRERRELKQSHYQNFFDTWDEAYQALLARIESKVDSYKRCLAKELKELEEIKELGKEPK